MNNIEEHFNNEDKLFTILFDNDTGASLNPDVRIWYGIGGGGQPFQRMLPILVHKDNSGPRSAVDCFKQFSIGDDSEFRIKPIAYSSQSSCESTKARVTYDVQPAPENATQYEFEGDPTAMANYWVEEISESAVVSRFRQVKTTVFRLQLSINIFTKRFQTYIPIFSGVPSTETLKSELRNLTIPCVTIVPKESEFDSVVRKFPTRIEPGIISTED